ncbi:hypothetical protein RHGRI_027355 [Rhododendron griersonianum]|uniref:GRF-type domain-containing protein n=1 Tax=Rhododendron griersonianum TaxID=479676 RepID=A0AAV6J0H9_9ERIC|nr:hypothetical protein RHGRI_027355 [Rhododendron griersonianum]
MSTSSTVGTQNYLRYRNRTCKCRERAVVKISESDKNPGRLYYTCKDADNGGCDFWAWCNPTNQINNVSQTRPTSQLLSLDITEGTDTAIPDGRVNTRLLIIEATISMVKVLVLASFILAVTAILMSVGALMK